MMTRIAFPFVALSLSLAACGGVAGDDYYDGDDVYLEGYADDDKADTAPRPGRFETFTGRDGQTYFHLLAANGQKVLHSEGYASPSSADAGVASVRSSGVFASRYQLLQAVDGQWYFNLFAGNWQIIGTSELYVTKANAERAINTVVAIVSNSRTYSAPSTGARFQVFKGLDGKHYFHLRAQNGEIVLQSQGYSSRTNAVNGTASVRSHGGSLAAYVVKDAANGQSYFILKAVNGQTIGVSETYVTRYGAERGAEGVANLLREGTVAAAQ